MICVHADRSPGGHFLTSKQQPKNKTPKGAHIFKHILMLTPGSLFPREQVFNWHKRQWLFTWSYSKLLNLQVRRYPPASCCAFQRLDLDLPEFSGKKELAENWRCGYALHALSGQQRKYWGGHTSIWEVITSLSALVLRWSPSPHRHAQDCFCSHRSFHCHKSWQ